MELKLPKRSLRWIVLVLVLALFSNMVLGKTGFYALYKTQKQCDELQLAVELERAKIDSLTLVEERLQNDPEYIERAARELLGVSRPRETVIKFLDNDE